MADVVETSEARWFKIVVFVVSGFFVGFSLANIVYFNRIRRNNGVPGITRGEATSMLWINAILFAISLIVFIWSIFRLVAGREYRQQLTTYFQEPGEGFIGTSETAPAPRSRSTRTTIRHERTHQAAAPAPLPVRRVPSRQTGTTTQTTTTRTGRRVIPGQ